MDYFFCSIGGGCLVFYQMEKAEDERHGYDS